MAGYVSAHGTLQGQPRPRRLTEPAGVRLLLTGIALGFLALFLVLPLLVVFVEALRNGLGGYFESIQDPDAMAANLDTLLSDPLRREAMGRCAWDFGRSTIWSSVARQYGAVFSRVLPATTPGTTRERSAAVGSLYARRI